MTGCFFCGVSATHTARLKKAAQGGRLTVSTTHSPLAPHPAHPTTEFSYLSYLSYPKMRLASTACGAAAQGARSKEHGNDEGGVTSEE